MSFRDVMDMPLRSFWNFNANVQRLRGEEALSQMKLFMLGGMVSAEYIESLKTEFAEQMKDPMKANSPVRSIEVDPAVHEAGISKLRSIAERTKPR